MSRSVFRPTLSDPEVVASLPPRRSPYFNILTYCRHIGLEKPNASTASWIARFRTRDGRYTQHRLGSAIVNQQDTLTYSEAIERAEAWFETPAVRASAAEPYPLGSKATLTICPVGDQYTVGHALRDYIAWKKLAATRSHFETLVSLINYHLVPRVSGVVLDNFNGQHFQDLVLAVIETPPKIGNRPVAPRVALESLSDEALRRRKKTVNALVSILRGAFEIAWERGELDSDVPMKCLRRLPNYDRPRLVFLDRDDCRRLLDCSAPDLRALILGALYTGCRPGELIGLRVDDVLPRMPAIYVAKPKGRRSRHVFLPGEGVRFFAALADGRSAGERLFRKADGRGWGGEYKSHFSRARAKANLPAQVTFHGLRHTYASQLIQAGASLIFVAEQLGHATTQTVSSTYGHLVTQDRMREIDLRFEPVHPSSDPPPRMLSRPKAAGVQAGSPRLLGDTGGSWPRANFAKYSGPLLDRLRRPL